MDSQLYTAASGLVAQSKRLDAVAHNLANLQTPGYRAQRTFTAMVQGAASSSSPTIRTANSAVALAGSWEEPGVNIVRGTGRALDVALAERQYLVVETPAGPAYTRNGALDFSATGDLLDSGGRPVLGPDGRPIAGVPAGAALADDGTVRVGGEIVATLGIVEDVDGVLVRLGGSLMGAEGRDDALAEVTTRQVRTGYLEGSGTNPLHELVDLIDAQRAFERFQRVVSITVNEVDRRAANDLAQSR